MTIRRALPSDIDRIMPIYATARAFMRAQGNKRQWVDGYPQRELIAHDIALGVHYLCLVDETPVAAFSLIHGEDPTYQSIEGSWLNTLSYATLHRIASDGRVHGVLHEVLLWASSQCDNLRIDTHADNGPMLHLLEKEGFVYCGIIHVSNGTPRKAFQRSVTGREPR